MKKEDRKKRVIARGEHSNHSHVVTGDAEIITNDKGEIVIEVGNEGAVLKHILEKEYLETGKEIWTQEHADIPMSKGAYKYIAQQEYDPYSKVIKQVVD